MSAATEICNGFLAVIRRIKESTNHVEPLISELPRLLPRRAVYSGALLVLLCRSLDRGNGFFQLIIHLSVKNRVSDVVA